MRQKSNGRGELLSFLKGGRRINEFEVTKDVQRRSLNGQTGVSVMSSNFKLSGISGRITDPLIVKEQNREYKFKNVVQTGSNEAIAEEMEVRQL